MPNVDKLEIDIFKMSARPARRRLDYNQSHELHAIFNFRTPAMEQAGRPPLDISVALDISTSMAGEKLINAKRSVERMIAHLTDKDTLTIVTFGSLVHVVLEPTLMTAKAKKDALAKVKPISVQGCTNLSGGVFTALDLQKANKVPAGTVRRHLLFTDGQANEGITKPEALRKAVLEYREDIGVSSFGYGHNYNAKLLDEVSQDGGTYHIDTPDKILTAYGVELGGLLSTFAQNVRLTLRPANGVQIVEILNDLAVKEEDDKVIVKCDDLMAEQDYSVVLKLKVGSKKKPHVRAVNAVSGMVRFLDAQQAKTREVKVSLKLEFVKDEAHTEDDPKVMDEVALQLTVAAQAEAVKLADIGNFGGARQVMRSHAAVLDSMDAPAAVMFSSVSEGLAAEHLSAESYAGGGVMRSARKSFGTKRGGVSGQSIGGVDVDGMYANISQAETSKSFEEGTGEVNISVSDVNPVSHPPPTVGAGVILPDGSKGTITSLEDGGVSGKVKEEPVKPSVTKDSSKTW